MEKQILRELYLTRGVDYILNPKTLRAYLLDMRVAKKTVNLLVDITRIEYFKQFCEEIEEDGSALNRLIHAALLEYAFDAYAIRHGAQCWAYAFTGRDKGNSKVSDSDDDIWPDETAELVAAALRELMQ